jgi:dTDP-4-dehydrorhamnose 3,5-epimerase
MSLSFKKTDINGIWLIEPAIYGDHRGHFLEAFREEVFREKGLIYQYVQDNISVSKRGTIRGLHYQKPPYAQAKLVMAISGTILDVAVDIRKNSPTFAKHVSMVLSHENRCMMYVPPGFAHGFSVLSDSATVYYKCNDYYNKGTERGIKWDDPDIGINWQIAEPVISEKDQKLPVLNELQSDDLF